MAKNKFKAPTFDEILFEFRNREYGAYIIRKKYNKYMTISLLTGIFVICTALITPYLVARDAYIKGHEIEERSVVVEMVDLDMPSDDFVPPPPPPPPPPDEAVAQQRYVPPVVVDSVKPEDEVKFITFDEIREVVENRDVNEVIEVVTTTAPVEVVNDLDEIPQFVVVEEPAMFPGGETALLKFVQDNVVYPERAKENNIQGRVFLQFVVTSRGNIGEVRLLRGVDPLLDEAAMEAVRKLPPFRPGRQGGVAVPVWYQLPVTFQLR